MPEQTKPKLYTFFVTIPAQYEMTKAQMEQALQNLLECHYNKPKVKAVPEFK